ncbi:MAG: popeye domain-containing protein [Crocinitomicaceae bacterium]|nr:popeye domain-containing protein [Crocinitomicaceae bacterium]
MSGWDWFVHGANILYLISYLVKDLFLLRLVLMVAMIVFLPYYIWSQPEPMWPPLAWSGLFLTVNVYQLYVLFKERRPIYLSSEDDSI